VGLPGAVTPAALHAAAGAGAAVVVGILVQHGADVNSAPWTKDLSLR